MSNRSVPSDYLGKRYGRLVVKNIYVKNGYSHAHCVCDCGSNTDAYLANLKRGNTQSCGCLHREISRTVNQKYCKHGNKLRIAWVSMKKRCFNPKDKNYSYYGARGIKVCEEWSKFRAFYDWAIANGHQENLTLERINNDGNYEPSNCKWATMKEQSRNRRAQQRSISEVNGVIWRKHAQRFVARITIDRNMIHLGYFTNFEDAVRARKLAEQRYWGKTSM